MRRPTEQPPEMEATGLRLDKYLWYARFARTRSMAARLCTEGKVTVAGITVQKPHQRVRVGDVVTVQQGRLIRRITILALGQRRGPADEAHRLYDEPDPPARTEAGDNGWTPLLDGE
jgi:ribosome-associated heat shock protein Hsp15